MSPRVYCNVIYAWLMKDTDEDGRKRIDGQLYAPADGRSEMSMLLQNVLGNDE